MESGFSPVISIFFFKSKLILGRSHICSKMLFLESLSVPCTMIRVWEIRTPAPAVPQLRSGKADNKQEKEQARA